MHRINASLLVAGTATLTSIGFAFSWLLNGGALAEWTHLPGLWKSLVPIIKWTLIASVAFGAGKGKGRVLVLAWAVADVFAIAMVNILQMDETPDDAWTGVVVDKS